MNFGTQARAEWRVLISAVLLGSGIGLALGATYMAAGMGKAASDYSRRAQFAQAATPHTQPFPSEDDAAVGAVAASGRLGSALDRKRELDCLTQAVYFEARGESPRGQAAVAQVVLNRVKHPAFPKSVCAVVFQGAASHSCQFSFACDGSMRRGREVAAWDRAKAIASRALSGAVLAEVGSATHFHTTGVSPGWGPRMLRVSQVGLHVFYRFNPNARAYDATPRAMFVSLPTQALAPVAPIRIASAIVEQTIDATLGAATAQAQPAPATPPVAQKAAVQGAVAAKPAPPAAPPVGLTKTSDTTSASPSQAAGEGAAS